MFFLVSPQDLRAPSTDRCETLPHDRKVLQHDNLGLKIWGALPTKKVGGQKRAKFLVDSGQLKTLIANISGTDGT